MKSYDAQFSEPKDGNWQNAKKYSEDHCQFLLKDPIPAEKGCSDVLKRIEMLMSDVKMMKAKLFDKNMSIKPWKANELSFYDDILNKCASLEGKFIKVKGDVLLNIAMMKRSVGTTELSNKWENARKRRRAKENKRKSNKRKMKRDLKSCMSVIGAMLPGDQNEEVRSKIEQEDFSFQISTVELSPLTRKLLAAGLQLLLAKGALTGQAKVFADVQLQKMADVTDARKASVAKKKVTGKQLTTEAALAVKRDDLVHSSSEPSDNETEF